MDVSLVINPIAGNRAFRPLKKIEAILKGRVSFTTFVTEKKGDAADFAEKLSGTDLVLVAGGDGTFNEVINGLLMPGSALLVQERPPLAFIPCGTANVLAKELGIPQNIEKAVHLALSGRPRKISLGRINNRYFSLMAGVGFDGMTVFSVKNSIKKFFGKGAYFLSGLQTLMKYNPPLIEIKTSEGTLSGYTLVVGKARCYGGGFQVTPKADLGEPFLDLCIFRGRTRKDLFRFVRGIINKNHLGFNDVFYGKYSEMEISSQGQVHVQIDGDYFGTLPARIDVVRDAVSIIV